MLLPLLFIYPIVQWLVITWLSRKKNRYFILSSLIVVLVYMIIRMLGYNSRIVWVDIFVWNCLGIAIGLSICKFFERKRGLKVLILSLGIILVELTLVINGVVTVNNWMWDNSIESRLVGDNGNIVVLQGCNAGGLLYTKYTLRDELLGGAFYKEYDKVVDYHPLSSDCIILLKKNEVSEIKYNVCKNEIIKF